MDLVGPGELAVIIGPNGAGKSTFLKLWPAFFRSHRQGCDRGEPLPPATLTRPAESGVSFVPQERNVFGSLIVCENLEMGGYLLRSGSKGPNRTAGVPPSNPSRQASRKGR